MNLKGFKKVKQDEHSATLVNQRGHQITLALKQLSKKHQEGLKNLPLYAATGADIEPMPTDTPTPEAMEAAAPSPIAEVPQPQPAVAAQPAQETQPLPQQQAAQQPQLAAAPVPQPQPRTKEVAAKEYTAEANKESALLAADIYNGHISPKTYKEMFDSHDTVGKIGTLFGLLMSSAGSGMAHQPNAVMEMMNKEIERDFEAQKKNQENRQNWARISMENELNKANIKAKGAETAASLADTQLKADTHAKNGMILGIVKDLQGEIVDRLPPGTPQRAQAQQTLSTVEQAGAAQIMKNNEVLGNQLANNEELAFQRKQKSLRAAGMLGLEGAESLARANDERHVPGFGEASIPVPGDVRQELIAKKNFNDAARKYIAFAKKHQNNWAEYIKNPLKAQEIANEGKVIAAELQGAYRMRTKGGVYKEGEQNFIESIVPGQPASWKAFFSQIPRVEKTIEANNTEANNLAKGYGLKGLSGDSQREEKPKVAEGATGTYNGKPVVFKNGKWEYQ